MANAILAAILSFLIPGLGQLYAGDLSKAVMMFVIFLALFLIVSHILKDWIFTIVNIAYNLYVAYDAYQLAQQS